MRGSERGIVRELSDAYAHTQNALRGSRGHTARTRRGGLYDDGAYGGLGRDESTHDPAYGRRRDIRAVFGVSARRDLGALAGREDRGTESREKMKK